MQIRPAFIKDAALLLAALAGRSGQGSDAAATLEQSFLEALSQSSPTTPTGGQGLVIDSLPIGHWHDLAARMEPSADALPANHAKALEAYTSRLAYHTQYEGLDWPVDILT